MDFLNDLGGAAVGAAGDAAGAAAGAAGDAAGAIGGAVGDGPPPINRPNPPGEVFGDVDGEGIEGGLTGAEGGTSLEAEMAGMLALQTQTQSILLRYNTESNLQNAAHSNRKSISDKLGQS